MKKRPTEQELLKDLGAYRAHADELAEPLPRESEPLEKLKFSVKRFTSDPRIPPLPQKTGMHGSTEMAFQMIHEGPWREALIGHWSYRKFLVM